MTTIPQTVVILAAFLGVVMGCTRTPPTPEAERPRTPIFSKQTLTTQESDSLQVDLLVDMPPPEFAPDRLNPDRLADQKLSFSCVAGCPEGLTLDPDSGRLQWKPSFSDAGAHFITYRVTSGLLSAEQTVPVVVVDQDQPPEVSIDQPTAVTGREAELIKIPLEAIDPDGDKVRYRCEEGCPAGASIHGNELWWTPSYADAGEHVVTVFAESSPETRGVVFSGLAPEDDSPALRTEVERLAINRLTRLRTPIQVSVTVENVNQPIYFTSLPQLTVAEAGVLTAQVVATDPDREPIVYECVHSCPDGFVLDERSGVITWTPSYVQAGTYQVGIEARAGQDDRVSGILQIDVINTNRQPYFFEVLGRLLAKEGQEVSFLFPARDDDPDDSLVFRCVASCPEGMVIGSDTGRVTWVPGYDDSGSHTFTIGASDGRVEIVQSLTITVDHVNRPPEWVALPVIHETNAMQALSLRLVAKDPDVEDVGSLRYSCESCPGRLTVAEKTGQLQWFPDWSDEGTHEVILSVTDGTAQVSGATRIKVIRLDRPPRFEALSPSSGTELTEYRLQVVASDPDGDSIRFECVSGCGEKILIDTDTGLIRFNPGYKDSGQYSLLIRASSNPVWDPDRRETKFSDLKVDFFIRNNNRAPVAEPAPTEFSLYEGDHATSDDDSPQGSGDIYTIVASDPDEDPLSYVCLEKCPPGLSVAVDTGKIRWVPGYDAAIPGDTVYEGIVFAVLDGEAVVKLDPVQITVKNVNRPPTLLSPSDVVVFEGGHRTEDESSATLAPLNFQIQAVDPDGDALVYACESGCIDGVVVDAQTGQVTWTPGYDVILAPETEKVYSGIRYSVTDGVDTFYTEPQTITVKNVNRKPVFASLPLHQSVYEQGHVTAAECSNGTDVCPDEQNRPLHFNLGAVDPDGEPVIYSCVAGCPKGLTLNSDTGEVFWRPGYLDTPSNGAALDENAPRTGIQFVARDPYAEVYASPMTITVLNVDRGPRVSLLAPVEVVENQSKSYQIPVTDPDGDVVETECLRVNIHPENPRFNLSRPATLCSDGYYFASSSFGYSKWLTVDKDTAQVNLAPGWFDSLKSDPENPALDQYQVNFQFRSSPSGFTAAPTRSTTQEQLIRVVNQDRPAPLNAPTGALVVVEDTRVQFSLYSGDDPDRAHGEYLDQLSFSCVGRVAEDGSAIGPCPTDPTFGGDRHTLTVDQQTGIVSWTPAYTHALTADPETGEEAFWYIKFRVASAPDGFQTPPETTDAVYRIQVLNNDRLPTFALGANPVTIHLWEPGAADPGNQAVIPESLAHLYETAADLPVSAEIDVRATDPDGLATDTEPEYGLRGCSTRAGAELASLDECPSWISYNPELSRIEIKDLDHAAALPGQRRQFAVVTASSCPKPDTGWKCGAPFFSRTDGVEGPRPDALPRIDIPIIVYNVDRPPTLTFHEPTAPGPGGEYMGLESSEIDIGFTWSDPDGNPVRFCFDVYEAGQRIGDPALAGLFSVQSDSGETLYGGGESCFGDAAAASGQGAIRFTPSVNPHALVSRFSGSVLEEGAEILSSHEFGGKTRWGSRSFAVRSRVLSEDLGYAHDQSASTVPDEYTYLILNNDRPAVIAVDAESASPDGVLYEVAAGPGGTEIIDDDQEQKVAYWLRGTVADPDCEDHQRIAAYSGVLDSAAGETGFGYQPIPVQEDPRPACGTPYDLQIAVNGNYARASTSGPGSVLHKILVTNGHPQDDSVADLTVVVNNVPVAPRASVASSYGSGSSTEVAIAPVTFTPEAPDPEFSEVFISELTTDLPATVSGSSRINFSGNHSLVKSCLGCSGATRRCDDVSFRLCYQDAPGICSPVKQTRTCFYNKDRLPSITVKSVPKALNGDQSTELGSTEGRYAIGFHVTDDDPEDSSNIYVNLDEWSSISRSAKDRKVDSFNGSEVYDVMFVGDESLAAYILESNCGDGSSDWCPGGDTSPTRGVKGYLYKSGLYYEYRAEGPWQRVLGVENFCVTIRSHFGRITYGYKSPVDGKTNRGQKTVGDFYRIGPATWSIERIMGFNIISPTTYSAGLYRNNHINGDWDDVWDYSRGWEGNVLLESYFSCVD